MQAAAIFKIPIFCKLIVQGMVLCDITEWETCTCIFTLAVIAAIEMV